MLKISILFFSALEYCYFEWSFEILGGKISVVVCLSDRRLSCPKVNRAPQMEKYILIVKLAFLILTKFENCLKTFALEPTHFHILAAWGQ